MYSQRYSEILKQKNNVQLAIKGANAAVEALEKSKKFFQKAKLDCESANAKIELFDLTIQENLHNDKKKEKDVGTSKWLSSRILGSLAAFDFTPEQEREKLVNKLIKKKATLDVASNDIALKKKELIEKIEIKDEATHMASIVYFTTFKACSFYYKTYM